MPGLFDLLHTMMGITPPPPDPPAPPPPSPHDMLMAQTKAKYPFIYNTNPMLIPSDKKGGEAWPIGETGAPDYPRPKVIPLSQHGLEVGPGSTPDDVAGEVLHVDPYANQVRAQLRRSLSPSQQAYLKHESLDYGSDTDKDSEDHRMDNAVDAAIRGTLVGQWPKESNDGMRYTAGQQQLLNNLQQYMRTGRRPQ